MAYWESKQLRAIIEEIDAGRIVLPVIQRRLVWDADKMTELFSSLLKGNAFGGIICISERIGNEPPFSYRPFSKNGDPISSSTVDQLEDNTLFVIDGQQRLQSFYIGLMGTYEGKSMYFDLHSDYSNDEFDFKFDVRQDDHMLFHVTQDSLWYPVADLYDKLCRGLKARDVARDIAKEFVGDRDRIEDNVMRFFDVTINENAIGLSIVGFDSTNTAKSRRRIVEMFRTLNNGGTILTSYDLMASTLKSFDARMEKFLDEMSAGYSCIGINQDNLIKLLIILFGDPLKEKEITDLKEKHATMALDNEAQLRLALDALIKFLHATKHFDWFSSRRKKSYIPIYFLTYHIFYKFASDIKQMMSELDSQNFSQDIKDMRDWLYYSLLNGAFSSGSGWKPTTGLNKIYEVMRDHEGKDFPLASLYSLYKERLHSFNTTVDEKTLDKFDRDYLFYLIYDHQTKYLGVNYERDHIHPRALLETAKVDDSLINSIGNFEILIRSDNRLKQDNEFANWLNEKCPKSADRANYLFEHLIPNDENLWTHDRFNDFLSARLKLLVAKVRL